jgi:hypothetical protein
MDWAPLWVIYLPTNLVTLLGDSCNLCQSNRRKKFLMHVFSFTQQHCNVYLCTYTPQIFIPWQSRHRIRLRSRRPGFESRQGIRFFRKPEQCCCVCTIDLICMHWLCFEKGKYIKALAKIFLNKNTSNLTALAEIWTCHRLFLWRTRWPLCLAVNNNTHRSLGKCR